MIDCLNQEITKAEIHAKIVLKMGVALFADKVNSVNELGYLLASQHCDELSNAGFWLWDYRTNEVYYSKKFCNALGFDYNDFGIGFNGFYLVDKEQLEAGLQMVNDLIVNKSNDIFKNELLYKTKMNTEIKIMCIGTVFYKENEPFYILGTHKIV
jgi:hypothetical protein